MTVVINSVEILDANGTSYEDCVYNYINKKSPNVNDYTETPVVDLKKFEIPITNEEILNYLHQENFNEKFVTRAISLAVLVTIKAVKDIKVPKNAVVIGVTLHTPIDIVYEIKNRYEQSKKIKPTLGANNTTSAICSTISRHLNTNSLNFVISQTCTSYLVALEQAKNLLELNKTDMVIVTGVDCASNPVNAFIFKSLGIHCESLPKPFSKSRSGIALGEAAVCYVLTREEKSQKKMAILDNICFYTDHHTATSPNPTAEASKYLLDTITNNNKIKVNHINCHATGTIIGDEIELQGLESLPYTTSIYGLKGSVGHTMSCSAGIEMAYSIHGLNNNWIPYTETMDTENTKHDLVSDNIKTCHNQENFIKLSFGFGGSSAAALISKC